jgi:ADP-ribose pyrophosphatase YjhB (NUDIX family)
LERLRVAPELRRWAASHGSLAASQLYSTRPPRPQLALVKPVVHRAMVVVHDGECALLYQLCSDRWPENVGKWCIPGVVIRPQETPHLAADRAICEALRIAPRPYWIRRLGEQEVTADGERTVLYFFEYNVRVEPCMLPPFTPNETASARAAFPLPALPPICTEVMDQAVRRVLRRRR